MKFSNTQMVLAFIAGVIVCRFLKKESYHCGSHKTEGYGLFGTREGFSKCSQCGI